MTDHKAGLTVEQMIDNAHDNYMRGNIDATTRDYLIEKAKRTAAPAASEGEDGAVAWRVLIAGEWEFYTNRASAALARAEYEKHGPQDGLIIKPEPLFARPAAQVAATPKPRCGKERHELDAYIWKRDSEQEWVLEISGEINGTSFISRHTEPLTTPPEDVAGLPSLYERLEAATPKHDEGLLPCPFCGKSGAFDQWPCEWLDASGANVVRCAWCHGAAPMQAWNRRALATQPAADTDECGRPMTYWGGKSATQPAARRVTDAACVWTLDDDESETWMSACGEVWQFTTGGPEDNGVRFCHHCGKPASFAQPAEGVSGG